MPNDAGIRVDVLRLDQVHPLVSGNKWFKLRYNLEAARQQEKKAFITMGGAFSNHLLATAAACQQTGMACIGIVRGEDIDLNNPTLSAAQALGMQLRPVSREQYKHFSEKDIPLLFPEWQGLFYWVPEGGANHAGAEGCIDILRPLPAYNTYILACGTGTTLAGICKAAPAGSAVIGISVLKGEDHLSTAVNTLMGEPLVFAANAAGYLETSCVLNNYHFGGYARHTPELLAFKQGFEQAQNILLDYVYTAKAFYAAADLIRLKRIRPGNRVLLIHTGGLQGNEGYEKRYRLKAES